MNECFCHVVLVKSLPYTLKDNLKLDCREQGILQPFPSYPFLRIFTFLLAGKLSIFFLRVSFNGRIACEICTNKELLVSGRMPSFLLLNPVKIAGALYSRLAIGAQTASKENGPGNERKPLLVPLLI